MAKSRLAEARTDPTLPAGERLDMSRSAHNPGHKARMAKLKRRIRGNLRRRKKRCS